MDSAEIKMQVVGYSTGVGLVQQAGCCVRLEYRDEYGRKSHRMFTYPIGCATEERAHLQAAHLALASVVKMMRKLAVVEVACPSIVCDVVDNPDMIIDGCDDVANEIRKWASFYNDIHFDARSINDLPVEDARRCAESQQALDTGTEEEECRKK